MVGAVAGTPGTEPTNWLTTVPSGITQQIVGSGVVDGITYIDYRFSGTATGTVNIRIDGESPAVAASGQAWTSTAYLRLVAGSLANAITEINLRQGTAAGALVLSTTAGFTPTSSSLASQRYSLTVASTSATTERIGLRLFINATGAIDITLRIGLPQLEQGAFATSVIPTSTTAVTRSADVASISGSNFSSWYRQDEGSYFVDVPSRLATTDGPVFEGADSSTFRGPTCEYSGNGTRFNIVNRTITSATGGAYAAVASPLTPGKAACSYFSAGSFASVAGSSVIVTFATTERMTPDRLFIGSRIGANFVLNGTIRRLAYFPRRLGNEVLQGITQ
jgi:hypothetical protein